MEKGGREMFISIFFWAILLISSWKARGRQLLLRALIRGWRDPFFPHGTNARFTHPSATLPPCCFGSNNTPACKSDLPGGWKQDEHEHTVSGDPSCQPPSSLWKTYCLLPDSMRDDDIHHPDNGSTQVPYSRRLALESIFLLFYFCFMRSKNCKPYLAVLTNMEPARSAIITKTSYRILPRLTWNKEKAVEVAILWIRSLICLARVPRKNTKHASSPHVIWGFHRCQHASAK